MGQVKGILLVSAAAVAMATGSSFAADLPSRKAAPAAYVKICDVYGRGFYYIPGTNTCLKVGGRVRFEMGWRQAKNVASNWTGNRTGFGAQLDTLGWRARAYVNMDARTQTAWGTVQTVFSIALRSRSGIFNGNPQNGPGGQTTASPQVYAAYIRFAGFTVGRAPYVFSNGPGFIFYWTNWSGGSALGTMQLAYTATFGGGFSATVALEDKDDFANQRGTYNFGLGNFPAVTPSRLPNLVLTLRLDQGWGYVRGSVAVGRNHNVAPNGAGTVAFNKTGWAVGADAKINLPSLARGDALWLRVAYANGLLEYATGGNRSNGSVAKDGRITGGWQPPIANATIVCPAFPVCSVSNWKALTAMVAFTHYWTPTLRSNFAVSYLKVTPAATARILGIPTSTSWQASGQLIWSPTAGFDIGLELYYAKIRHSTTNGGGQLGALLAGGVKQNPTDLAVKLRVQRTF